MNNLTHYKNVVDDVLESLSSLTDKALARGIDRKNIIWDPGLGFSKSTNHNISILKNIERFTKQGFPVLLGPSRKRFIGEILSEENPLDRLQGTSAIVCRCVHAKVAMVRVHDISEINQTISMASKIW